jgi:hypothetical protein
MHLRAAIRGDLERIMAEELAITERGVTAGITQAAGGLKAELRRQITASGLGARLAKSWRSSVYPARGTSLGAAGVVWSKAPHIVRAFDEGALIRSRSGLWLAIPTSNAPKKGLGGKRISPANFPEHRYGRLRFVWRPRGPSLLVVDDVRVGASGRVGRRAKDPRLKSGALRKGLATVAMFLLVPQVRLRKRLDIAGAAAHWERRLAALITGEMVRLERAGERQ